MLAMLPYRRMTDKMANAYRIGLAVRSSINILPEYGGAEFKTSLINRLD